MKNLGLIAGVAATNQIYDASKYMTKIGEAHNGVIYNVDAEGTTIKVLHTLGSAYARGYAQGLLAADDINAFAWDDLDGFFKGQVTGVDKHLTFLPKWVVKILEKEVLEPVGNALVDIVHGALKWVFNTQRPYLQSSPVNVLDEIKGMADGICSQEKYANTDRCKDGAMEDRLRRVNMLPDLVRMQCSMMGAWGDATANGGLIQMRTLDFGSGPFANNNMLIVHHPEDIGNSFASLGFPGFVAAITGFSEKIAQSEKVDYITSKWWQRGRPAGSYKGQGDAFVIRDTL